MVANYSESEMEPKVLPSRYPNLLVNGTFGIAVGLATNIPPHNLEEVTAGVLAYIDKNDITTSELMKYIKGPDLPTGGILIGENSMLSAYETGEGKVAYRAKTSIENLENGRLGIVITEFPYRRN
jgi:topoisomerase-4 subunit A